MATPNIVHVTSIIGRTNAVTPGTPTPNILIFDAVQTTSDKPYRSIKILYDFECARRESRPPYATWYSESMGQGQPVFSVKGSSEWTPVIPDTVLETLFR